jgi:N-acyl-D-aspartate/D-glutamate deacylase
VHAFVESDHEAIEIGRRAGIPTKIGHIKAVGLHNEGAIAEIVRLVEEARAAGHVVVSDQYPYDGAATATLSRIIVLPEDLREPVEPPDLDRLLADPSLRARIKVSSENGIDGGFAWLKATGYTSMRITSSLDYPELVGRYLSDLAIERGEDPFDLVSDLILGADDPVGITLGAVMEQDVRDIMVQSWNMIASDGAYSDGETPQGHPRSTGTFPRILGRYVREWNVLTLEEAVRKITSLPAETVRLSNRGLLDVGYAADIAIFDPSTVIDRSTWDEPQLFATGVYHVLVNGIPVLRDGEMTGASPGTAIRRNPSRTRRIAVP